MVRLRTSALALLLLAPLVPVHAPAQGRDVTLAVLPFGSLARTQARTATALISQEVAGLAQEAEVYTVLDRSTDEEIEREMQRAQSFRNFDSKVQLETTTRLNATALLIGVIEDESIERRMEPGQKPKYAAKIGIRVKIVHTATGQLIRSERFEVQNESAVARGVGGACKLPKMMCDRLKQELDEKVAKSGVEGVDELGDTEDEARRNALKHLRDPMIEFLQDSYGAVLAASRRK